MFLFSTILILVIYADATTTASYHNSKDVSSLFNVNRITMTTTLTVVLSAIIYGICWIRNQEKERTKRFATFMSEARAEFGRAQIPAAVVETHMKLRAELFQRFGNPDGNRSLAEQDVYVALHRNYDESWQRKIPPQATQEFKAALLRRTLATLPVYEASKRDFEAKAMLFNRNLIADNHWKAVKEEYEGVCEQLKLILFDADCLEHEWGTRPNGLLHTATAIIQHEINKQKEEAAKKEAAKQEEKERLKQEKLKTQAEKEAQEKLERDKRAADAALQELLQAEKQEKTLKQPSKKKQI